MKATCRLAVIPRRIGPGLLAWMLFAAVAANAAWAGLDDLHPSLHPAPRTYPAYQDRELTFHPGHYVLISDKTYTPMTGLAAEYRNAALEGAVLGIQKRYYWKDIETSKDVYDFSTIDADVAWCEANGRQLIPLIGDKIFFGEFIPVPDYVARGSEYGSATTVSGRSGTFYGVYDQQGDGQHIIARRWNKPVEERFLHLLRVLGERYDSSPVVEAIYLMETAPGYMTPTDPDYSDEKYYNYLLWRVRKVREYWPSSQVFQSANGFPSLSSSSSKKYQGFEFFLALGETLREVNGIMSGPDILPLYVYTGTPPYDISNYENFLRTLYRPQDNQLLLGCSAQYDSYWWHTDGSLGNSLADLVPMQDIFNAGFEEMNLDYIFYVYRPDDGATPNAYWGTPTATTVVDDVFGSATVQAKFPRTYDLSELPWPNPLTWIKLDETSGGTAFDSGLAGNDGVWGGGVAREASGRDRSAAGFASAADAAVTLPDIAYTADTSPLADNTSASSSKGAISLWFRISATELSTGEAVQHLYHHDSGSGDAIRIYIDRGANQLVAVMERGAGNQNESMTADNFSSVYADGAWHHLVLNFNYKVLTLYLDGGAVDMETHEPYGAYSSATDRSYTGINPSGGITLGDNPLLAGEDFNGALDELRIYGDFLTVTQIHALLERPGTLLAESGGSAGVVELNWEDYSSDEEALQIQQADSGSGPWAELTTVTANTVNYSVGGLTPDQTYYFRVRKTGGAQRNSEWNLASAAAGSVPLTPPDAPTGLTVQSVSSDSLAFAWSDNSADEDGFRIYFAEGSSPSASPVESVGMGTTNWTTASLSPNTAYSNKVTAYNAAGESADSNSVKIHTLALVPNAPLLSSVAATSVTLEIPATDGNPSGTDYLLAVDDGVSGPLWVQADGSLGASGATSGSGTPVVVEGLAVNTSYTVRAYAMNGDNVLTSAGAALDFGTLTVPALLPVVDAVATDSIALTIDGADGNPPDTLYQLRVDGPGGVLWVQADGSIGNTAGQFLSDQQIMIAGLEPAAMYSLLAVPLNRKGVLNGDGPELDIYTMALIPDAPLLSSVAATSVLLEIPLTDGNPSGTEYLLSADDGVSGPLWVQADGSLGASGALWGGASPIVVVGLEANTSHTAWAHAVNGDGVATAPGAPLVFVTLTMPSILPTVSDIAADSIVLTIDGGDGNPSDTLYRVRVEGPLGVLWAEADGSLGNSPALFLANQQIRIEGLAELAEYRLLVVPVNHGGVVNSDGPELVVFTKASAGVPGSSWLRYD